MFWFLIISFIQVHVFKQYLHVDLFPAMSLYILNAKKPTMWYACLVVFLVQRLRPTITTKTKCKECAISPNVLQNNRKYVTFYCCLQTVFARHRLWLAL